MARPDEVSNKVSDKSHQQTDSTQSKGTNAHTEAQAGLKDLKIDTSKTDAHVMLKFDGLNPVQLVDSTGHKLEPKKTDSSEQKQQTKQEFEKTADGQSRIKQTDFPDGSHRDFQYDKADGQLKKVTEPNGDYYLKNGDKPDSKWLKIVDGENQGSDYGISVNKDSDVTVKNPDGSSRVENHDGSAVEKDKDGRVTEVDHGPGKGKAKYHYDKNGDVDDVVKADGQHWRKNTDGTWKEEIPAHVDKDGKFVPAQTNDHQKMKVSVDKESGDLDWVNNPGTRSEQHSRTTHDGTYVAHVPPELQPIPPVAEKADQMTVNEANTVSALLEIMKKDTGTDLEDDRKALQSTLDDINKQGPEHAKKVYDAMSDADKKQVMLVDVLQKDGTTKQELMLMPELKPPLPDIPIGPGGQKPPENSGIVPPDIGPDGKLPHMPEAIPLPNGALLRPGEGASTTPSQGDMDENKRYLDAVTRAAINTAREVEKTQSTSQPETQEKQGE